MTAHRKRRLTWRSIYGRTGASMAEALAYARSGATVLLVMQTREEQLKAHETLTLYEPIAASLITVECMATLMTGRGRRYAYVIADHRVYERAMDEVDARLDRFESGPTGA